MGVVLVPVIGVIIALVLVAYAVKRFGQDEVRHSDRLQKEDRPTVRYEVPNGQDPAAVLAELRGAGYDASPDSEPGPSSPIVIIGTHHGGPPDRERLRVLLAQASANLDPPADLETATTPSSVRFQDE